MSKSKETVTVTENRTVAQDFGPEQGSHNVAAAYQGLYHLLGARVERWDVTADGVYAIGLTFDADRIPSVEQVIHDISYRGDKAVSRDLPLLPTYFWVNGNDPLPFEDAGEMTQWMAKFTRGSGEGDNNRSPQYVKDAITAFKTQNGIASRRGRPPTKIAIENLGDVDDATLARLDPEKLAKLEATLQRILSANEAESVTA